MMKKTISLTVITVFLFIVSFLLVTGTYLFFEPEMISAISTSTTVTVSLAVMEEISLTPPNPIVMSPNITATQNSSIGGTSTSPWIVKTNSVVGYTLRLQASTTPALQSATSSFNDAATSSPLTWGFSIGNSCYNKTTCFGFSVFGADVSTTTWGTGNDCGSGGTPSNTLKYLGFQSTTSTVVANRGGVTSVSGATTTMCVAAAQHTVYAASGNYSAIIIGTATTD